MFVVFVLIHHHAMPKGGLLSLIEYTMVETLAPHQHIIVSWTVYHLTYAVVS